MVYGSRSASDGATLSDSEDHDLDPHGPDDMVAVGMELSGQVMGRFTSQIDRTMPIAPKIVVSLSSPKAKIRLCISSAPNL